MKKLILILLALSLLLSLAACGGEDGETDAPAGGVQGETVKPDSGNTVPGNNDTQTGNDAPQQGNDAPQTGNTPPQQGTTEPEGDPLFGRYYLMSVAGPEGDEVGDFDLYSYASIKDSESFGPYLDIRIFKPENPRVYGCIRSDMKTTEDVAPTAPGNTVYRLGSTCVVRWNVIVDYTGGTKSEKRYIEYNGSDTLLLDLNGTLFTFQKNAEREAADPVTHILEDLEGTWISGNPIKRDDVYYRYRCTFRPDGTMLMEYLRCDEEGNIEDGQLEAPAIVSEGNYTVSSEEIYIHPDSTDAYRTIEQNYCYIDNALVLCGVNFIDWVKQ